MAISVYRRCLEVFVSTSMSARPATILSAARGAARYLHVAGSPSGPEESLAARAERVAAVAAKHAAVVDHDSRVPAEAIAAARAERLLGAAIPSEFGGRVRASATLSMSATRSGAPAPRPR